MAEDRPRLQPAPPEQQWHFDWIIVDVDVEEEPPVDREAKDACKDGRWQEDGFRNQGRCSASVVADDASVR